MAASSGGFNSEDIRLCYRYLREAEGMASGFAKTTFREASLKEKQAVFLKARTWAGVLPAAGEPADSVPPAARKRGRPRRMTAPDTRAYSVLLPVDDLAALQALGREQGESVSFHIREAIRRYLKDRRKEKS